jgi:hypothetical protein
MSYVKRKHPDVPIVYYANGGSPYLDLQKEMDADVRAAAALPPPRCRRRAAAVAPLAAAPVAAVGIGLRAASGRRGRYSCAPADARPSADARIGGWDDRRMGR